jgi:hypothetical protein
MSPGANVPLERVTVVPLTPIVSISAVEGNGLVIAFLAAALAVPYVMPVI